MEKKDIRKVVREQYAGVVKAGGGCCGPSDSSCGCGAPVEEIGRSIGYTERDLGSVPAGANLGLGCGNPAALATLAEGETVLDLGSGAGFDCFLAAEKVGPEGRVIGVDMTPEMIEQAREHAEKGPYGHVEFRLGEIENLPAADGSVDVILSNCVINLSPEKERVFREAWRILKPGGRMMVSDIVLLRRLPDFITASPGAWAACIAGASLREEYLASIAAAGFREVEILGESPVPFDILSADPAVTAIMKEEGISPEEARDIAASVVSLKVGALKE